MKYWLVKSEGSCYSIDDLKKDKKTAWTGIRNFQARNHMRNMSKGDLVLFYHSSSEPMGVFGIAKVVSGIHSDATATDPKDEHFDPRALKYEKEGKPAIWECVDIAFVEKLKEPVTLKDIKSDKELKNMLVAKQGMRLSVMPVEEKHFKRIKDLV